MNLWGDPDLKSFCVRNVPLGEEVIIVVIGIQENEQYFFKQLPIAITSDMDLEMEPVETSLDNILEFIGGL